jgi:IclR family acetate operon transcriptional repressor
VPRRNDAETPDQVGYSIRAVKRVCDLLDLLQREPGGASLARAAEVTNVPKSSAFRYLVTLEERRYVERDPVTGDYRLGLALLPMQTRQLDVLTRRARPYLDRLQAEFGETTNLGLLDGNRVVYLDIVESPHAMRLVASRGDRDALHSTALGKALAAKLPVDQVRSILRDEGMPRHTQRTLTTQREYLAQLDLVRKQGYAIDDEENEVGARCVGVALPSENLPLAISVAGPAARLTSARVPEIAERLQTAAHDLAAELGMLDTAVAVESR